jgi:UDP-4-amino-4,6-dideoxy-N-acetyl-beta-L-altrosamine N-acetyltransferase
MVNDDLDQVLEWRNHPDIRKNMYTNHVISREEHYRYFEKVWNDPTVVYLICEGLDGKAVGVVNFVKIDKISGNAYWAFYSGDLARKGLGTWMEFLALNYAFETLGLLKLSCEVLDYNMKVVNLHRKFGFTEEGVFRKQHKTPEGFADIYRLSI